jgi:acetyl-CoA acetyltransferase
MPFTVPVTTVNRLCGSGLEAIANLAGKIRAGYVDCGIGGGIESMSMFDMMSLVPIDKIDPKNLESETGKNILLTTGQVAEICSEKWGTTREQNDFIGCESQNRAFNARESGKFKDEIVPVEVTYTDPKSGEKVTMI